MQSEWTIYHNPRCGKSRKALELLEEHGVEPEIVLYLKAPPVKKTLVGLLRKLGMRPRDVVRTGEPVFRELKPDLEEDSAVLQAIVENPILLERPIVVHGDRAVLGRPPEKVLELL